MEATATSLQILAKANLFNAGKGFCVIQSPDGEGGAYVSALAGTKNQVAPYLFEGEKILWAGTPKQFANEKPVFTETFLGNTREVSFFGVS